MSEEVTHAVLERVAAELAAEQEVTTLLRAKLARLRAEIAKLQEDRAALSLLPLTRSIRRVLLDVAHERAKQTDKWGDQLHDPFVFLAILGEEYGEACQAAQHDKWGGSAAGTLRAELIQVAAVAVAMIEGIAAVEKLRRLAMQKGGKV